MLLRLQSMFSKALFKPLINQKQSHYHLFKHLTTITGHTHINDTLKSDVALQEASEVNINNGTKLDEYNLVYLIRECTKLGFYCFGQQLHCYVLQSGFSPNSYVSTAIINFYIKFESINQAHKVFDETPEPSVVSWNSLISGYVHCGEFSKALGLFRELEKSAVCSDSYTFTAALAAFGKLSLVELGKSVHSKIVKSGIECSVFVCNCLIDMYGKCGFADEAIRLFNEMNDKDTFSWNSVIAATARNQRIEQAFSFLKKMPEPDTISFNELINGIAQFGSIEDAITILATMPNSNSSSWNSIITGYVNRNRARDALGFFSTMHLRGIKMDQFTFSSLLSGVGSVAALAWGTLIHCYSMRYGLDKTVVVGSALIDMYSKCGCVVEAEMIFHSLPFKNLVTWNAMISGYAHNGNSTKVIELFEHLKMAEGLKPDEITFVNVLSACWHNRVPLRVAKQHVESMKKDYGVETRAEHCSSIIRLMGQEGEVRRAKSMIHELELGSCVMVWRALLGACGAPCDLDVAEAAAAKLIELEDDNEFVYVKMSNIYAICGKWEEVVTVRKLMRDKNVKKEVGCSWVEE